jgi:hypothetical protein
VSSVGVLLFGFAAVNASFRLFHPRAYASELEEHGFRVYDSLGRLVHDVARCRPPTSGSTECSRSSRQTRRRGGRAPAPPVGPSDPKASSSTA